ncbi:DNA/RNA nuclease SfsA [Aestuariirhabdus litorea]|uniref:Sugar fermentation stimulation protein homolog n=1 Tax=Aestuariirhabdus litorea TaxID=2528527 RepID=A0A3P3VHM9_9GAMM|nr:DNA/RNA nuclease SfsA [Aestuariirhabdus litorea]RRJ82245.1 DNA/RNA nuclease SfsA [Aestuariirhabdus litorea]RWW92413.1 DNA/RNA nuclease SfsA [Endozoicomonadaceae bacterium GTF-13]
MIYSPPLLEGRLVRRYKRFLADIETAAGDCLTLHCPNTGSMKNCALPGSRVWFWDSGNSKRKYPHTWELVETSETELGEGSIEGVACINTARPNQIAHEAIESGVLAELRGYSKIRREVAYGEERSRIDLLLQAEGRPDCYVEVKSVTLAVGGGLGLFPDAVTARGSKHLRELMAVVAAGGRAVLLFVVPHTAIDKVAPASMIDPEYANTLRLAVEAGVEVIAYGAEVSPVSIGLTGRLPFALKPTNIKELETV